MSGALNPIEGALGASADAIGSFDAFGLDLDALAGAGLVDVEEEARDALQDVSRRISGQYADQLAGWAARVLASPAPARVDGIRGTVHSLIRLADGAQDPELRTCMDGLLELLDAIEGSTPRSRRGDGARVGLRAWLGQFAGTLALEDADRVRGLLEGSPDALPLLDELRGVRGVGPQRLQRLCAAGLASLDAVTRASPDEVAAVTGLPLAVAQDVVARARAFAIDERRRCVDEIQARTRRLRGLLRHAEPAAADELRRALAQVLSEVEGAFEGLLAEA